MKNKTRLMVAMAAVIGGAVMASAGVHAQTKPLEVWQPPQQEEADPAKRVPQAPAAEDASGVTSQSADSRPQRYTARSRSTSRDRDRGGFFLGVQGGKGRVYEGVDQSALLANAGYRWQAGDITLIGIELAGGKLDDKRHGEGNYPGLDLLSLGANARFNFGSSPVYALVRAGYWSSEDDRYGSNSDGGYAGGGLGVDFNRHFNMSVIYTTHVYATNYDWEDGYEINSADTLMLGAEVRF